MPPAHLILHAYTYIYIRPLLNPPPKNPGYGPALTWREKAKPHGTYQVAAG